MFFLYAITGYQMSFFTKSVDYDLNAYGAGKDTVLLIEVGHKVYNKVLPAFL